MKVFEANINHKVSGFLNDKLKVITSFEIANQKMSEAFGIQHFFENNEELEILKKVIADTNDIIEEPDRAEYGDFQTNVDLANKMTLHLVSKNISPEVVVEPTCGKGNFIVASLRNFKAIKNVFGIEIYKPYVWETKFNIINFFLENPESNKPEIAIVHCNVFDFEFKQIAKKYSTKDILIIGNPPWVTNSKLGSLSSSNLPKKTNFKNHSGLDAMTGKGNFDIAEYITMTMIKTFQKMKGHLLLLVKNSVIKNIVFDQNKNHYEIASIEKQCIDSKKEFNVSVEASLFYSKLNSVPEFDCKEFNFYDDKNSYRHFGWLNDKFVSNIDTYLHTKDIDGESPFIWRQGLKHDCSAIMELDKVNDHYVNGLNEEVKLEDGLVYGILKSSDLKNTVINQTRKFTIVTQKKVGQETKHIQSGYPQTYQYLTTHQKYFDARKSSIYNNKPSFSIFGIGDYSFKSYKVAISGLYKTFHFTLILPQQNKPVMLDDTCYFIGFDKIEFAMYALILLNSGTTMQFLQSVTFADAKRTFTKDVLMRIDLLQLAKNSDKQNLKTELNKLNEMYKFSLTLDLWDSFLNEMTPVNNGQMEMFI
jgi:predicted 3-demethylubiquinone-9 3-methyltransferase (glyoxalase superfamily)